MSSATPSRPAATTTELTEAWAGWHTIAKPMRPKYQRFVELANEGARELGFDDSACCGARVTTCRSKDFEKEAARLYEQVKPLYKGLHCYARKRLAAALRQGQGARRQADPGALVRQHVGAAVEPRLRRPAEAVSGREHRIRRPPAAEAEVGRGQDDEVGRELLHLDRLPGAAADVLGALDAHAAARPRSRVPRQRLGHRRQGRRAHQDVHQAHRGRPVHGLPRARPRLLLHLVQGPAASCSRTARTTASTKPSATPSTCR